MPGTLTCREGVSTVDLLGKIGCLAQVQAEVKGSCKHSSLLHYGQNYDCKKFYSTCPSDLS